jgi:hypothetical protein
MRLTTLLSILVLTTFAAEPSWSITVSPLEKTQSSNTSKPEVEIPICYMKTTHGKILNLANMCKPALVDRNNNSNPNSLAPYDDPRMKASDDALYGRGN